MYLSTTGYPENIVLCLQSCLSTYATHSPKITWLAHARAPPGAEEERRQVLQKPISSWAPRAAAETCCRWDELHSGRQEGWRGTLLLLVLLVLRRRRRRRRVACCCHGDGGGDARFEACWLLCLVGLCLCWWCRSLFRLSVLMLL